MVYHPDKQAGRPADWARVCVAVTQAINQVYGCS